uniref:Secreted protein n=1 Tax=Mesocestoides corti TaxID=53468 RepID=A0A5K3FRW4_MESCO
SNYFTIRCVCVCVCVNKWHWLCVIALQQVPVCMLFYSVLKFVFPQVCGKCLKVALTIKTQNRPLEISFAVSQYEVISPFRTSWKTLIRKPLNGSVACVSG